MERGHCRSRASQEVPGLLVRVGFQTAVYVLGGLVGRDLFDDGFAWYGPVARSAIADLPEHARQSKGPGVERLCGAVSVSAFLDHRNYAVRLLQVLSAGDAACEQR